MGMNRKESIREIIKNINKAESFVTVEEISIIRGDDFMAVQSTLEELENEGFIESQVIDDECVWEIKSEESAS